MMLIDDVRYAFEDFHYRTGKLEGGRAGKPVLPTQGDHDE
jgi:hypothetical protein